MQQLHINASTVTIAAAYQASLIPFRPCPDSFDMNPSMVLSA